MKLARTIEEVRAACRAARSRGGRLGLVPTMGALHEGHLSLGRAARSKSDLVAASIFVNPTPFGPSEDFAKYPRNLENDFELLEQEDVELLFATPVQQLNPKPTLTCVLLDHLPDLVHHH